MKILLTLILSLLLPGVLAAQEEVYQFEVRKEGWKKPCEGPLTIASDGIRYEPRQAAKHCEARAWSYSDVQELQFGPHRIAVLTYEDRRWLLGADRRISFAPAPGHDFGPALEFLLRHMDQRLVAAMPAAQSKPVLILPAKRTGLIRGVEGTLSFYEDGAGFETDKPGESRAWRMEDLESIGSASPFDLTLTTYERSRAHFGGRREFHFQLREPLPRESYDGLWRWLNREHNLEFLQQSKKVER